MENKLTKKVKNTTSINSRVDSGSLWELKKLIGSKKDFSEYGKTRKNNERKFKDKKGYIKEMEKSDPNRIITG